MRALFGTHTNKHKEHTGSGMGRGARTTVNGTFSTYFTFRITHLITVNGGDFYFTVLLLLLLEISYIIYMFGFYILNYLFFVAEWNQGQAGGKRNVTITNIRARRTCSLSFAPHTIAHNH